MPSPLEDRIRELCLKAAVAQNEADLDQIIRQLRAALTEYIHDARIRAVEVIPRTSRSDKKTADSIRVAAFCSFLARYSGGNRSHGQRKECETTAACGQE